MNFLLPNLHRNDKVNVSFILNESHCPLMCIFKLLHQACEQTYVLCICVISFF